MAGRSCRRRWQWAGTGLRMMEMGMKRLRRMMMSRQSQLPSLPLLLLYPRLLFLHSGGRSDRWPVSMVASKWP